MLRRIETLLRERGAMSTHEIALCMDSSEDAVKGMLQTLENKGRVRKSELDCGKGCATCTDATQWQVVDH